MIKINPEDCETRWVSNDVGETRVKRIVIALVGNYYIAVGEGYEHYFSVGRGFTTEVWSYAKPIEKKLTAVVKSAEEITGIEGCTHFNLSFDKSMYSYLSEMNQLVGERIEVVPVSGEMYHYRGHGFLWLKSWLKDFKEKVK